MVGQVVLQGAVVRHVVGIIVVTDGQEYEVSCVGELM
jgi:hypothetical protein